MSRAVKSISFKLADPFEKKLLNHAEKYPNFSSYIKRLIQRDMEGGSPGTKNILIAQDEDTPKINANAHSFI